MSPVLHRPVYTLHIELLDIEPPIWRRFEVPAWFTLADVHTVIQLVMGWHDSHLHGFDIGGTRYGLGESEWDEDERDAATVVLGDVGLRQGDRFRYTYDFGDHWEHVVTVEAIRRDVPESEVPRLLGGERACPPEDCGGVPGYYDLLDALADPEHEEHEAMREWLGRPWDPEEYDVALHDRVLRQRRGVRQAARRTAGGASSSRGAGRRGQRKSGGPVPKQRGTAGPTRRRGRDATPPHMARASEVLGLMDPLRRRVPWLPESVVALTADLIQRFCLDFPEEFLAVRKPELWLAAGVHAAFMLHPRALLYPVKPLTLDELSHLCAVSPASISRRSGQLRQGVRVEWRPGGR